MARLPGYNGLQVEVIGSLHGLTTYNHTYTLDASATEPSFINFGNNLLAVDSVQFIPSETAATTAFYTYYFGPYFAMDNMDVDLLPLSTVPEPGTWVAAVLALAAITFSQRDRLSRAKPIGR